MTYEREYSVENLQQQLWAVFRLCSVTVATGCVQPHERARHEMCHETDAAAMADLRA